jgi:hydrogenase large subunit
MQGHHITDAVYLTERICGICSTVHGANASYLLDKLYDNEIEENAQYLRNIMLAADFLQNHIRHFYFFELPDYVVMPERPPFLEQNCTDCRLNREQNQRLAGNYLKAVKASEECHQILALFGGKAPHQHSFMHGGVASSPTADKIAQALALLQNIRRFVADCMMPDTEIIAALYDDYFHIGCTDGRFLSFGLFRFGEKNDAPLLKGGVLENGQLTKPRLDLIQEDITHAWYQRAKRINDTEPAPHKLDAYTWTKAVLYQGNHFEGGPLARMIINGRYHGGTSTMDRIVARSMETLLITELMENWLHELRPGEAPIKQKKEIAVNTAIAATDAMRGPLLHSALIKDEQVVRYDIITPTGWNFSPKDDYGRRGPAETALVGTRLSSPDLRYIIPGRIIRSFDPCIACATH